MLRLLFTTEDNSKQLTVITDGLDSQLNVFVTENVVGAIEYYKSIGIVIEAGHTYNIGQFKEWAFKALVKLISYPEGFGEEGAVLSDVQEVVEYVLETKEPTLNFPAKGGDDMCVVTSSKQTFKNGQPVGHPEGVPVTLTSTRTKVLNGVKQQPETYPTDIELAGVGFDYEESGNNYNLKASENTGSSQRTGKATISQDGGKTAEVTLTQNAATVTYEYTCTVDPTTLSFAAAGETKIFGVTATKQKKVNGSNSGIPSAVTYTTTVQGEGFTKGSSEYSVVAAANTGAQRTGTAVVTTTEGNKTATVTLTQLAGA